MPQGFGRTYFSRTKQLVLKQRGQDATPAITNFASIKNIATSSRPSDAMLILKRCELTSDILDAFSRASLSSALIFYPNNAMNFEADLQHYIDYAAFCSFIGCRVDDQPLAEHEPGLVIFDDRPGSVAGSKGPRKVFGDQFDQLANRTIFVSLAPETGVAGPLSLSVNIAYQLGTLKLEAQSQERGYPGSGFSDEACRYFSTAYAYLFAKYLTSRISFRSGRRGNRDQEALAAMLKLYSDDLQQLDADEKPLGFRRFLLLYGRGEEEESRELSSISLATLSTWPSTTVPPPAH